MIRVESLSKRYRIGHRQRAPYATLRESLVSAVRHLGRRADRPRTEDFWALKDINFAVERGDRVGIIGRNGAGKSTLLKILSRITCPTTGRVELRGRVASLLEVGTGFHPELTGRENIFLNGAILGMTRADIRQRFDSIVSFAEVEYFLDTPVKRYSSGMYVRLAFAVAAHLEPDVLIVDEVLAVGDAQFQKKCLGKMDDASRREGRTVLFVSHNITALRNLCSSIIYLKNGQLIRFGGVDDTIARYLQECSDDVASGSIPRAFPRRFHTGHACFVRAWTTDLTDVPKAEFHFGEEVRVHLELDVLTAIEDCLVSVVLNGSSGEHVALVADTRDAIYRPRHYAAGRHHIIVTLDARLLPMTYSLSAFVARYHNGEPLDWVDHVFQFSVSGVSLKGGGDYPWGVVHGYLELDSSWNYDDDQAVRLSAALQEGP